ncbi:hypothetical protein [Ideonella sp. A 288]|uniref:hypothetical protein n=1 Tax=Ideonella sp. A 288 TaxID=1962181 RepID=UPI000B4A6F88|nr:hypothetical protein [Ideonella sp. A 288]
MAQASLRSVTLQTIENYRHAAEQTVEAYRASGMRLIGAVNKRLDRSVYPRAERFAPAVSQRLQNVNGRVTELATKGLDKVTAKTDEVIEFGSTTAATQVSKAADRVARFEQPVVANGLKAAARLSMAGAQVALALSARLAEGAVMLATAATGPQPAAKARRAAKVAARKPAVRARRAVATMKEAAADLGEVIASKKTRAVRAARKATPQAAVKPATRKPRVAKAAAGAEA